MTATDDWGRVTEARCPAAELSRLAGLRDRADVRVTLAEGIVWVRWTTSRADVVRALLPARGVTFFRSENGVRYPFGRRLPAGDTPPPGEDRPLPAVLIPESRTPILPDAPDGPRVSLRLVRGGEPKPVTALLCPIESLRHWADTAPTAELAAVCGLVSGGRAVLFGAKLPPIPGATRFHGADALVPVGFRLDPDLPDAVVRAVAECGANDVLVFTESGLDHIPRDRAEPLTRAGLRLALTDGARP